MEDDGETIDIARQLRRRDKAVRKWTKRPEARTAATIDGIFYHMDMVRAGAQPT